jgi:transposase
MKALERVFSRVAVLEASGGSSPAREGGEAQVDYDDGPTVRDPHTGKYRRARLFVFTLGFSRRCVRLLTFQSSARIWTELREQAFRGLGGFTKVVVLDNLREGVLGLEFLYFVHSAMVPAHRAC